MMMISGSATSRSMIPGVRQVRGRSLKMSAVYHALPEWLRKFLPWSVFFAEAEKIGFQPPTLPNRFSRTVVPPDMEGAGFECRLETWIMEKANGSITAVAIDH
ncbi:MAG: hypothetical protein HQL82_10305 [Magnetococcales bacterium]|nr:hypothetical protein [Magnetococcales bacterium]